MKYFFLSVFILFAMHGMAQDSIRKPMVVYKYPEAQPKPEYDLNKYIAEHLHYPDKARRKNVNGRVIVKFIVTETGTIDSAKVVRGIGAGCDEEALRVVTTMPSWTPGKQNGKPVNVYFMLPVVFRLE